MENLAVFHVFSLPVAQFCRGGCCLGSLGACHHHGFVTVRARTEAEVFRCSGFVDHHVPARALVRRRVVGLEPTAAHTKVVAGAFARTLHRPAFRVQLVAVFASAHDAVGFFRTGVPPRGCCAGCFLRVARHIVEKHVGRTRARHTGLAVNRNAVLVFAVVVRKPITPVDVQLFRRDVFAFAVDPRERQDPSRELVPSRSSGVVEVHFSIFKVRQA